MNDFYVSIVHQDRMADLRHEADATRRARTGTRTARVPRELAVRRRLAAGIGVAVVACLLVLVNTGIVS